MKINMGVKKANTILGVFLISIALMLSCNVFAGKGKKVSQAEFDAAVAELNAKISAGTPEVFEIGHTFSDGNIVFWVDETGQHGLAAWSEDEVGLLDWYQAGAAADARGPGWRLPTKAGIFRGHNTELF